MHVNARKLTSYTGNYAQFERERAQQLALQQASYVKQQRQVAHLHSFIDRFRAKATKAKQAQSRIKALERMELIAAAHVDSPFEFTFPPVDTAARQLVLLEHATLGYDRQAAGAGARRLGHSRRRSHRPARAQRRGQVDAAEGDRRHAGAACAAQRPTAQNLQLGYFAQHQVEQLREDYSPLWHLRQIEPDAREQELRDFLGGFDFRGDMASAAVGRFSGGEKARLTLALIVRQKPNLLLLDEPTNHLDIEMREALTEALQDFGGALVVVAHDRHLLRATTDALWLVADGKVAPFDGDLDDYRDWVLGQRRRERAEPAACRRHGRRTRRSQGAEARGGGRAAAAGRCAPPARRAAGGDRKGDGRLQSRKGTTRRVARGARRLRRSDEGRTEGQASRARAKSRGSWRGSRRSGWKSPRRWKGSIA